MTKTKARLGAGDVEIELDGETVVLRPTLKACQAISRQAEGVLGAIGRVQRYDLDTYVQVVTLGLGAEGKEAREMPGKVFRTGMMQLIGPVTRYLMIISNGGRPAVDPDGTDDTGGAGEEDENPQ